MSWQEELHKLDSALATGQIAADDYRKRRDELLAQASGQVAQAPQQPAAPQPAPQQPSVPESGQTPFPPAFKWQPQQPPPPNPAESTTIIPPITPGPPPLQPDPADSDRTQVVGQSGGQSGGQSSGHDADRTQVVSSVDRTQVVPNYVTSTPPPGMPMQQQPPPPWATQHPQQQQPAGGNMPPWANDELPPGFGTVGTSWPRQGPEIFEERSSGKGKIIAIVVAAVVVLGAAATVFFMTRGSGEQAAGPSATSAVPTPPSTTQPTPTGPKLPDGPFVPVAGTDAPAMRDSLPVDDAIAAKVPTEPEAKLLKQSGIGSVSSVITTEGQLARGIWAFTPTSSGDPKTALAAINKEYRDNGHKQQTGTKPGVTVWVFPADAKNPLNSYRAHFITGGQVVRVEAYGPDQTAAKDAFDELLNRVTSKYPPTE